MKFWLKEAAGLVVNWRVSTMLPVLSRPAMAGELVPANYFQRLERSALCRDGQPLEVDLGCGDGTFLIEMARENPERQFLGVERMMRRARTVCRQLVRNQISNARLLHLESRYTVEWLLPEAGVSRLHLLCPDPWPKVRHHRRRLVQTDFLEAVWRVLEPGGEFLFMTDHDEYHAWSNKRLNEFGKFERLEWPEDAFFYPKSDFQRRWESEGRTMWRTRCRKGF